MYKLFPKKIIDKFLHTILYADDANIIVTSANYIDLQKKSNFISATHFWIVPNKPAYNK
jgi:hypothetical protein